FVRSILYFHAAPTIATSPLSLHDALPIFEPRRVRTMRKHHVVKAHAAGHETLFLGVVLAVDESHELAHDVAVIPGRTERVLRHQDRKSTRLNSSHVKISYAVFCLKKKTAA